MNIAGFAGSMHTAALSKDKRTLTIVGGEKTGALHSFHKGNETTTTTYLVSDLIASPLGRVENGTGRPASGQKPYEPKQDDPPIVVT